MEQINQAEIIGGEQKSSKGPTISAVIIVIILILGGAYILLSQNSETPAPAEPESSTGESSLRTLPAADSNVEVGAEVELE